MEKRITYFEDVRADNTETTFSLARERLKGSAIKKLVLASTTGATAERAAQFFRDEGVKLIVVPHQFDFKRDDKSLSSGPGEKAERNGTRGALRHDAVSHGRLLRLRERNLDGQSPAMLQSRREGMLRDRRHGNGWGPCRKRRTGDSHSRHGPWIRHGPGHAGSLVAAPEKTPGERDPVQTP